MNGTKLLYEDYPHCIVRVSISWSLLWEIYPMHPAPASEKNCGMVGGGGAPSAVAYHVIYPNPNVGAVLEITNPLYAKLG